MVGMIPQVVCAVEESCAVTLLRSDEDQVGKSHRRTVNVGLSRLEDHRDLMVDSFHQRK